MRILVTGASGFVGQNLVPYLLESGFEVVPLDRKELVNRDFQKLTETDAIIHLAGKAHDVSGSDDADEYFKVNFDITKDIYNAFLDSPARYFIFLSSIKALTDVSETPARETDIPDPKTPYGLSKLEAERYIVNRQIAGGKEYYILRPSMIHGPGNKGNLNLLYQFVSKGIPYPFGAFDNRRSFLSINNLCAIIGQLLRKADVPSGIYHTADDESVSTNALIALISQSLGEKPRIFNLNRQLVRALAKLGDILRLPLNTHRLNKLTENFLVDNTKIKQVLAINLPATAIEGLKRTFLSFRKK